MKTISDMTDSEKLDFYLERAELGNTKCQYWATQLINSVDYFPNRKVEALKWLIIATMLNPTLVPFEVMTYMQTHLSDEERDAAFNLAQLWLEDKSIEDETRDESLWSLDLLEWKYPKKDLRQNATEADIEHWVFAALDGAFDTSLIESILIQKLEEKIKSNWTFQIILKNKQEISNSDKSVLDDVLAMGQRRFKLTS